MTATQGQTAPIALQDNSECVEDSLWWGQNGSVIGPACSGSPGEEWNITTTNEIRWGSNQSLCLTTGGVGTEPWLAPCTGASNQLFGRSWPIRIIRPTPIKGL